MQMCKLKESRQSTTDFFQARISRYKQNEYRRENREQYYNVTQSFLWGAS
jgi:hypothetical protein